jgi:hypothetical protein
MLHFVLSLTNSAINLNDLKCQSLAAGSYRSICCTPTALTNSPTYFHTAYWRGYMVSSFFYKQYADLLLTHKSNTAAIKIIMKNSYENSLKCQLHTQQQFMNKWKGFKPQVLLYKVREPVEDTYILNKEHLIKSGLGWRQLQENLYLKMYSRQTCIHIKSTKTIAFAIM